MRENWPELANDMSEPLKELSAAAPGVMEGFSALAQTALQQGALDTRTKELIALGISVAVRCDACIAFHAAAAVRQGATRDQVSETRAVAIYMGAGPSVMYAAKALEAYDQSRAKTEPAAS